MNSSSPEITIDDLISACKKPDYEKVKAILSRDMVQINAKNKDGETALIAASACGRVKLVNLLLKEGANADVQDKEDRTALEVAARNAYRDGSKANYRNIIERLLKAGANPNIREKDGSTAIFHIVGERQMDIFRMLLKSGADPNIQNNEGSTKLMDIASSGYGREAVEFLLKAGANPNLRDKDGRTALILAAISEHGSDNSIGLLLKYGASIDSQDMTGRTALMYLAHNGKDDDVSLLLDAGADPNIIDNAGETALIRAVSYPAIDEDDLSINNDEDTDMNKGYRRFLGADNLGDDLILAFEVDDEYWMRDEERQSHLFKMSRIEDIVEMLLRAGADPDGQNKDGRTALIKAAQRGHAGLVRILVKAGADPCLKDKRGNTALSIAKARGYSEIERLVDNTFGR